MLQPYLTKYLTDRLILPFLGKDLKRKHQVLLQVVVKSNVLDKCVSVVDLLKINLSIPDIYLKVKDRHFGFSTEERLKNLERQDKITSADVRNFKEASNMVVAIIEKIAEKSPLHFSVVRNANVFDPISMATLEPVESKANMRNLLTHTVSLKIVLL